MPGGLQEMLPFLRRSRPRCRLWMSATKKVWNNSCYNEIVRRWTGEMKRNEKEMEWNTYRSRFLSSALRHPLNLNWIPERVFAWGSVHTAIRSSSGGKIASTGSVNVDTTDRLCFRWADLRVCLQTDISQWNLTRNLSRQLRTFKLQKRTDLKIARDVALFMTILVLILA